MSGFAPNAPQIAWLEKNDSSYKFTSRCDVPEKGRFQCEITDNRTGRPWAEGFGDTEADAFKAALASADIANRPLSEPEQSRAEINRLQAENEELRRKLGADKSAAAPAKSKDKEPAKGKGDKEQPTKPPAPTTAATGKDSVGKTTMTIPVASKPPDEADDDE